MNVNRVKNPDSLIPDTCKMTKEEFDYIMSPDICIYCNKEIKRIANGHMINEDYKFFWDDENNCACNYHTKCKK